jgi:hypothetical protein
MTWVYELGSDRIESAKERAQVNISELRALVVDDAGPLWANDATAVLDAAQNALDALGGLVDAFERLGLPEDRAPLALLVAKELLGR